MLRPLLPGLTTDTLVWAGGRSWMVPVPLLHELEKNRIDRKVHSLRLTLYDSFFRSYSLGLTLYASLFTPHSL